MKYNRILKLSDLLNKKSFFLFGARGTGKSYLIRNELNEKALIIDLLRSEYFLQLTNQPSELESILKQSDHNWVVIDEVQKIPALLDEVHRLIEETSYRFLLTGSSARKLKRENANMLAHRAWRAEFFPLCYPEFGQFDLEKYLMFGGLPAVYGSEEPIEELDAYIRNYLVEEVQAEGWVRKLPQFSRFLKSAALSNGNVLNFDKVAADCQVSPSTVREYFYLLSDTLIGYLLEPWTRSKKRKAISTAKFYFFDVGVTHMIAGTKSVEKNSDLYGKAFEQFICIELKAALSYKRIKQDLGFWRTTHGDEVDFTVGESVAIEVKAANRVSDRDARGLKKLQEENIFEQFFMISHDRVEKNKDGITYCHWQTFLEKLWGDKIL